MSRKLPPLKAIKVFEAVARLSSFTKAAQELCVSPAAVSQQVKIMEDFFSIQLIDRSQKQLRLTAAGKAYYPLVNEGFERLSEASHSLITFKSPNHLKISSMPSIASKWLAPNLFKWCDKYPEIETHVLAQYREVDFLNEDIDFRVCYGAGNYQDACVHELFVDRLHPVCSPSLMRGENPLTTPMNLKHHTLLHVCWEDERTHEPGWPEWLEAAGVEGVDTEKGHTFNVFSLAVEAALDGRGILLGQEMLVADDLAAGRLVKPFELSLPLPEAYYVIYPKQDVYKAYSEDFLKWLLSLAGSSFHP